MRLPISYFHIFTNICLFYFYLEERVLVCNLACLPLSYFIHFKRDLFHTFRIKKDENYLKELKLFM